MLLCKFLGGFIIYAKFVLLEIQFNVSKLSFLISTYVP